MANLIYTMEAANLFCGSAPSQDGVNASNHLTLTELQLPGMDEQYVDHRAGGAPVAIEIDTVIARLEASFMLIGWTPQVQTLVKSWVQQDNSFFAYGVIRDRSTGAALQAAAQIFGRLGRSMPQNWRRGDVQHWNYTIRGITKYQLTLIDPTNGGATTNIYNFDFFANTLQIGDQDVNADLNTILQTGSSLAVGGTG